jgi:hypothetical protein
MAISNAIYDSYNDLELFHFSPDERGYDPVLPSFGAERPHLENPQRE